MSNEELIQAYYSAIELKLDEDFIEMLEKELIQRNIKIVNNGFSR
ncbi:sporulation histidine kinase inhibitor Sda [Bacillus sp. PS06]|nr:sporulation histidine kinase inhibitor Sda [Bacillus sp. PS06]MBD8070159.1 sporulation histidine kinase inhibitor Sda [Bacillus sp. PS06]